MEGDRRWSFRRRSGQNENGTIAEIDEDRVWVRNDERQKLGTSFEEEGEFAERKSDIEGRERREKGASARLESHSFPTLPRAVAAALFYETN